MKCSTPEQFKNRVLNKAPQYLVDQNPRWPHIMFAYAAYTSEACRIFKKAQTFQEKLNLSFAVLYDSLVIKDELGLFTEPNKVPFTSDSGVYTLPSYVTMVWSCNSGWIDFSKLSVASLVGAIAGPTGSVVSAKVSKCECGKEKHGFANHSQWCDLAKDNV